MDDATMQRLGVEPVRLLHQIGYFRDLDAKRAVEAKAHAKRYAKAIKNVKRRKR
jgi:hypothetical protein